MIRDYWIVKRIRKKQPGCKCVIHFHCDVKGQTRAKYKTYFLKKLLKITDHALVLNKDNEDFLRSAYAAPALFVPNFIDEALVAKQEKRISGSIERAMFVGYVQPRKGASELFELAKRFPCITFELLGEVRGDVKEWEKPDNVLLQGRQERQEIMDALDSGDVFVFPTYSEGFSIALLESMARGLPCITTPVGANQEMLEGKGGLIVPVGDVEALVSALEQMDDPKKRRDMSQWNVQKVRSEYTVQTVMKKFAELYQ
jgi:glycosyltransferase involved in cell wall biosynthesis